MIPIVEPLFVHRVRGPISSSPLLVDANGDGWPEVFVGGPVLSGLTWDGKRLPRWPKRGRRPFASSPAFGDINGDGRGEIVIGGDDGRLYAFYVDGARVGGWPVPTGRDVFSTPALADLDGDNALEVIVGSDDGAIYVVRGNGATAWTAVVPNRPFVSASPTVADLIGDKTLSVAVGAWDGCVHVWTSRGVEQSHRLPASGNVVWSSTTAFGVKGTGLLLSWAAEEVFVASPAGPVAPGWPKRTESWMVSSPAVVELRPGSGATVLVGAERVYAWDLGGRPRPGWPVDVGDFVWSSPIAFDLDGDGAREAVVGSWDGGLYAFRPDGSPVAGFPLRTNGPIFATPAAAPLPSGGGILVAASWDGTIRGWQLPRAVFRPGDWGQFRGSPSRTGWQPSQFDSPTGHAPETVKLAVLPSVRAAYREIWSFDGGSERIVIEGDHLGAARKLHLWYDIAGEGRHHRVPAVNSRGRFVALVQPLRMSHRVRFWIELEREDGTSQRWPTDGTAQFVSKATALPIPRLKISRRG